MNPHPKSDGCRKARMRCLPALLLCAAAVAQAGTGKLLLTGGVTSIDGAAGGGLGPWAVIGSNATEGEWGGTAFLTTLRTGDYGFRAGGVLLAWDDRVEVSLARQRLDTRQNLAPLGLPGLQIEQDVLGLKWRLAGDAVLDADRWLPQLAVGLMHKRARRSELTPTLTGTLGAKRTGSEAYLAATKLWLETGLLANLTLRLTKANQGGLLGHGGAQEAGWRVQPELSLAKLLSPQLALGIEARAKPNNLRRSALGVGALAEDDAFDAFLAWAPNKQVSLTLAYVDLGAIAPALQPKKQRGTYLSLQLAF
jgi:Protein of unknown function (DUF3034)